MSEEEKTVMLNAVINAQPKGVPEYKKTKASVKEQGDAIEANVIGKLKEDEEKDEEKDEEEEAAESTE